MNVLFSKALRQFWGQTNLLFNANWGFGAPYLRIQATGAKS
jgi:hypothetical protein